MSKDERKKINQPAGRRFHTKVAPNRIGVPTSRRLLTVLGTVFALLLLAGVMIGFGKLRALWLDQCVITDMASQVEIESGKMVKADVLADEFGIRTGANLALIDFTARRETILRKIPNLRDLQIVRTFPNRVRISQKERIPMAQMGLRGSKRPTGRVVDADGVVFNCWRSTCALLPRIVEPSRNVTAVGARLNGRAYAALQLLAAVGESEFQSLKVLDLDISHSDYILATLGPDYSSAKIAWEGMDTPTVSSHEGLLRQLRRLMFAIRANVDAGPTVWDATETGPDGRIYSRGKGGI